MNAKVAMITAAAHRAGKQLVRELATDGYDVAVCSLAVLPSRVRTVESLGRRACALRLLTMHPASAARALDDIHRDLGRVHALIHLDGDSIVGADGSIDATTETVKPDLIERRGTAMFLFDQPRAKLRFEAPGVTTIAIAVADKASPPEMCGAIMRLLREPVAGSYVLRVGRTVERVG